ncbi:MAG: MarR family transcriptional regulator, partial [Lactiplantibacillus plantarum]|nr:MarR family transcriptional regulator [Lactiplantibacillus plantarum]
MPDFSFRDRPDKQRVQLTLGKASSSADAEQVLAFLDFQWTFRTMQATYEQLLDQYQLSESKFIILMLLENETDHTLLPSELATKLGSARATVSKLLVGLQKRGWVE